MKKVTNNTEVQTLSLVELYAKTAELFNSLVDLTVKREEFLLHSKDLRAGIIEASDKVVVDTLGFFVIPSTQNVHLDGLFLNDKGSKKDIMSKRQAYKASIMAGRELGKHGDRATKLLLFLRERSIALKTPIFEFNDAQFEGIKAQYLKAELVKKKEAEKTKAIELAKKIEQDKINTERSLVSYDEAYDLAYAELGAKRAQIVIDAQKEAERVAQVNQMLDSGKVIALDNAKQLIAEQDEEQDEEQVGHVLQNPSAPSAPSVDVTKIAFNANFGHDTKEQAEELMNTLVGTEDISTLVCMARMILAKYEKMN